MEVNTTQNVIHNEQLLVVIITALSLLGLCLMAAVAFLMLKLSHSKKNIESRFLKDTVTGGKNSVWFHDACEKHIKTVKSGEYAIVVCNLDKFAVVNERFGRQHGDNALAHIYEVITSCIDGDELAARIAADNFGLLLKADDADTLIQRIYDMAMLVNEFNYHRTQKYFLTLSFGIYVIDDITQEFLLMEDYARIACRKARMTSGSGLMRFAFFTKDDHSRLIREKQLENRIENAFSNHYLQIYLQPKYSLKTNEIVGAEALVRWDDPELGFILPSQFIDMFERNGFIMALDLYVFNEVCAMLRRWIDSNRKLIRVSFNLSRVHLSNDGFLDKFEQVRKQHNVPAHYIEFELTETLFYKHFSVVHTVFEQLRGLGYACSLDDFGSGYSSLGILKTIRTDIIKLDRAFFLAEPQDMQRARIVVESVVDLAHKLGIITVAEGVESEKQLAVLREIGCDMVQAFLFSQPVPVDEFERLVDSGADAAH